MVIIDRKHGLDILHLFLKIVISGRRGV